MMIADKLYVARWTFPDGYESIYHARMTPEQQGKIETLLQEVMDRGTILNYEIGPVEPGTFRDLTQAIGEETRKIG